ncbi:hypothetical protein HHI36_006576 [Cryptolaemus montrouzieri]|uniref:Uncharacterized protein n=1 Tax=Cryptolaemus montrouzieri TaxID=559131 RepID=A0ABD2NXH8_9CUCU
MKIYSADGSYTENIRDTEFGWYFQDLETDSDEENGKNKKEKKMEISKKEEIESSCDFTDVKCTENKPIIMVHPSIEVYGVENAIECREYPENVPSHRFLGNLGNIESQSPTKEEIASLIEPYSIKSGTLLSVVSNAKLLSYKSKYLQLFIAARASAYRYLIKDKEEIKKLIEDFELNRHDVDSPVSLLSELIFTDKSSPIDYFLFNTKANESGALLKSVIKEDNEHLGKMKCETDSGVDESISSCSSEMRNDVLEMHQSFESMNDTVERLIEKAEKLEKDLIQTTYLDDLLHLLNGNIEKVKTIKLPFSAFTTGTDEETVNLVI